jgi:hypothetical protein
VTQGFTAYTRRVSAAEQTSQGNVRQSRRPANRPISKKCAAAQEKNIRATANFGKPESRRERKATASNRRPISNLYGGKCRVDIDAECAVRARTRAGGFAHPTA